MVPIVGNWFNAQQVFNSDNFACSAGQTIAEYCSKAQDSCCAVCPNAPITGPGTLIVMTLGTFVNLLFVLWYQSEAPYNLAYQIVATDGAAFGMLNRLIQPEFNLSQFHYAFVPLAIMSCVPLALAATLNDYPSYHSHTPNAYAPIAKAVLEEQKRRERAAAVPLIERRSSTSHALGRFSRNRVSRPTSTHTQHGNNNLVNIAKAVNGRPQEALDALDEAKIPRKYLITTAWIFFTVHLIFWFFLFIYVYFMNDKFNQPQCAEKYPLKRISYILSGMVFGWWTFALLVWIGFTKVLFYPSKQKRDLLETIGRVLHITTITKEAGFRHRLRPGFDSRSGKKLNLFPSSLHDKHSLFKSKARARSIMRWSISIGVFCIWCLEYMSIYFVAVRDFVMIGMNGFDFGQIVAVVSIMVPVFLIMRAQLDYKIYWDEARKTWARGDHEETSDEEEGEEIGRREPRRNSIENESDGSLPEDYTGLSPHLGRSDSTRTTTSLLDHSRHSEEEEEHLMSGANGSRPSSTSSSRRSRSFSRGRRR
ncbi:hypothetical protein JCM5350_008287 [Sporobolomyces pararoseus]